MADAPERPCETRRRWFRPTPGWCVLGLLAVEGVLLLSERFEWFAFNRHKGYTVLIAVATVSAAFLLMFLWFLAALVFRWRFQFSILSLLGLAVVVALVCGRFFPEREQASLQREAVAAIRTLGGTVTYDYEAEDLRAIWRIKPARARPCRRDRQIHRGRRGRAGLLGVDFFADVTGVGYQKPAFSIHGSGPNPISDRCLVPIGRLQRLDELDLECSHVSDGCLVKLQGLTRLRTLNLAETEVMDSGLCVVRKLTRLEVLNLRFTRVSDLGLDSLVGLTHLRELDLSFTPVTDAGLEQLTGLGALRDLDLSGTHVTAGGVRKLQRALPMCDIASPWTSATHAARTGFGRGANVAR